MIENHRFWSLDQMLPARIQEEALNCHPTVDSRHRPLQRHGRGHSHRLHHPGLQQGIRQGRPRTPADQTPPRGRRRQPSAMDEIISHRTNTEGLHRWRRILSMRCHIWCATRQRPGPPPLHHLHKWHWSAPFPRNTHETIRWWCSTL